MNGAHHHWTHMALWVSRIDASVDFYEKYAGMSVVTSRTEDSGSRVAYMADRHKRLILVLFQPVRMPWARKFVIALLRRIRPPSHIGVECDSQAEIKRLCDLARSEGILRKEPRDSGGEAGFTGFVTDPDGNELELSFGQNLGEYLS